MVLHWRSFISTISFFNCVNNWKNIGLLGISFKELIMSNGSSGCGYEYRNHGGTCPNLSSDLIGFRCLKYIENLEIHPRSKEPLRSKNCINDAVKLWESERAKIISAETLKVRNSRISIEREAKQ